MPIDRRRYPRIELIRKVTIFDFPHDDKDPPEGSFSRNISSGGVCVATRKLLRTHDLVSLDIELPTKTFRALGVVAWTSGKMMLEGVGENIFYVGIKFVEIDNEDKSVIERLIFKTLSTDAIPGLS
ncbi:MAG: PilZ domain-containing protein [Candidatus Omnitrophica bacterium]|nr:PilZ domain-containing protein [Candidatus Omnitrophota bacterium]